MKHILMLLENFPYPQDGRVRKEAETLTDAGYRVTVIAPAENGQTRHEVVRGVSVYRFPTLTAERGILAYLAEYGWAMVATAALSLVVWRRAGFDIIHAHNPPDLYALIAGFYKLFGKRFVYDHHDLAPEMYRARLNGKGNNWVFSALVAFERLSCRLADLIIVTNESYRRVARERGGVPDDRIVTVRNGPPLDSRLQTDFEAEPRDNNRALIVYVGVTNAHDGVDHLLRALHALRVDLGRDDFCCTIAGDGDAMPDLRTLTQELDLGDYVNYTGWLEQAGVARVLSTADICVAPEPSGPYHDQSTSIKLMEYMAFGKPIVAFDLPEHGASAGQAAVYARPNDPLDFARQIALLMDNAPQRVYMGEIGRQRIETGLAWEFQAANLVRAYGDLIGR